MPLTITPDARIGWATVEVGEPSPRSNDHSSWSPATFPTPSVVSLGL